MRLLILLVGITTSLSCQKKKSTESAETPSHKAEVSVDTLCFQQILKRDTTTLRLLVNGTTVTGYLDINPYEKDRARGPIEGTLKGNQIHADWDRAGEGVVQRYGIDFTLQGDAITWHEGERVKKLGVWVLKQPSRGYEYVLNKTDCR